MIHDFPVEIHTGSRSSIQIKRLTETECLAELGQFFHRQPRGILFLLFIVLTPLYKNEAEMPGLVITDQRTGIHPCNFCVEGRLRFSILIQNPGTDVCSGFGVKS